MQKKIILLFFVLFGAFFIINTNEVMALNSHTEVIYSLDDMPCTGGDESLFGDPTNPESVAYFLQQIFNLFKYAAPLLCLVLSIADFSSSG